MTNEQSKLIDEINVELLNPDCPPARRSELEAKRYRIFSSQNVAANHVAYVQSRDGHTIQLLENAIAGLDSLIEEHPSDPRVRLWQRDKADCRSQIDALSGK